MQVQTPRLRTDELHFKDLTVQQTAGPVAKGVISGASLELGVNVGDVLLCSRMMRTIRIVPSNWRGSIISRMTT